VATGRHDLIDLYDACYLTGDPPQRVASD
jgi:hypothetical protein